MRWTPGGSSDDVEDRRDESGGGGGFQVGGIHLGLGGVVILFILSLIFKRDFLVAVKHRLSWTPARLSANRIPRAISRNSRWSSSSPLS